MVDKITQPITPVEEIEKINEIIDDSEASKVSIENSLDALAAISAKVDLSNLSTAGQEILDNKLNKQMISNCVTEIPQDIKLELNNGTLTLKAGSKVYMPNGSDVFDVITNSNDLTCTQASDGKFFVCEAYNAGLITTRLISACTSGAGVTAVSGFAYNTTTNKINNYSASGTVGTQYTFPIAIITVSNGAISSVDQVFNGFGYIGSTIFALPGVKGLIPNGLNEDGTLKNIELVSDKVFTRTWESNPLHKDLSISTVGIGINTNTYKEEENFLYNNSGNKITDRFVFGKMEYNGSSPYNVTSFQPKTTFHAVDYFDAVKSSDFATEIATTTSTASFKNPAVVIENYRSGNNWYRVWSDGWIEQGGYCTGGDEYTTQTITFLKAFSNSNYTLTYSILNDNRSKGPYISSRTSTNFTINQGGGSGGATTRELWYACGY